VSKAEEFIEREKEQSAEFSQVGGSQERVVDGWSLSIDVYCCGETNLDKIS
jgi:hypothetical protein